MSYTVKGTPRGYDVGTAIDYLLSFDASWPLLKTHETASFGGTVTHGLGYPPFHFMASTLVPGGVNEFAGTNENYGVSTTQLDRSSGAGTPRYYIFRLDLTTNFTAPIISGSTVQTGVANDYVFKITKTGKNTSSTDMRDFSLHSNTRSPMVHLINHSTMNAGGPLGWQKIVAHGLGYIPTAFAFIKPGTNGVGYSTSRYCIVPPPVGVSSFRYSVDAVNITVDADNINITGTPSVSIVVFKDPFNKDTVSMTYP